MGNKKSRSKDSTSGSTSTRTSERRSTFQSLTFQRRTFERSSIFPSVKQLTTMLADKAVQEQKIQEIPSDLFARYVFPSNQELGKRLFLFFKREIGVSKENLTVEEFCKAVEAIFETEVEVDIFLKMYGKNNEITLRNFRSLVTAAYTIAMDHFEDGPKTCPYSAKTIKAVVNGAFLYKTKLRQSYLSDWILGNCPRLTCGMHHYIIYRLCSSHRQEDSERKTIQDTTPTLKEAGTFEGGTYLPLSEVWLLSISLPDIYILHPQKRKSQVINLTDVSPEPPIPKHWTPLYKSGIHGLGTSAFNLHVLNYPDPTVMVIRCDSDREYCIASSSEWREQADYWGTPDCTVLQIYPEFHCKQIGQEKALYFNASIRGNPVGIRAGGNPNRPVVCVNIDFSTLTFEGSPQNIQDTLVWGCGLEAAKKSQLDMKARKERDSIRAQTTKMSPEDWTAHPDRYLLEMGGHSSYTQDAHAQGIVNEKSNKPPPKKPEKKR